MTTDPNQVRINELARELEVKAKAIIDLLPGYGVTEKKTHSSSIPVDVAEKVRKHLRGVADAEAAAEAKAKADKEAKEAAAKAARMRPAAAPAAAVAAGCRRHLQHPRPLLRDPWPSRRGSCCDDRSLPLQLRLHPQPRQRRHRLAAPGTCCTQSAGARTCCGHRQLPCWQRRRRQRDPSAPPSPQPGAPLRPFDARARREHAAGLPLLRAGVNDLCSHNDLGNRQRANPLVHVPLPGRVPLLLRLGRVRVLLRLRLAHRCRRVAIADRFRERLREVRRSDSGGPRPGQPMRPLQSRRSGTGRTLPPRPVGRVDRAVSPQSTF